MCLRLYLVLGCSLIFSNGLTAAQTIKVWHENAKSQFVMKVLTAAMEEGGITYKVESIRFASMNEAFEGLSTRMNTDKRLDIVVSGVNKTHEAKHLPIYFPFENGLLGFRVCMINPSHQSVFSTIKQVSDFGSANASILLVEGWPDVPISIKNGLPVEVMPSFSSAIKKAKQTTPTCFSRSVIEAKSDSNRYPSLSIESHLALIYPFTDILYVSRHNKSLFKKLSRGMSTIVKNGVHRAIFEEHYGALLENYKFYDRKLIILNNPDVSQAALEAINRYGVASFFYGK